MLALKSPECQDKPFACNVKGCDMTFTNKDHLEWHSKKHEMMLNLGLVNKNNEVADQTPTPTRFIRNCEEVGLFQDLQNVNPFDEIFKKAADLAKNGVTIDIQSNNSEDTLHTPHILPHITESQLKPPVTNQKSDSDYEPFNFPINNSDSDDTIIHIVEDSNIKKKIKENLLNKKPPLIKLVPFQELMYADKKTSSNIKPLDDKIEQIREMNRAAQVRCRKKKQQLWKEMEQEVVFLKEENKKLKLELEKLKLLHSKCPQNTTADNNAIVTSVITPESSQISKTPSSIKSPSQQPLLIQIFPNSQLCLVPSATSKSTSQEQTTTLSIKEMIPAKGNSTKKRYLKKIAPRILLKKS